MHASSDPPDLPCACASLRRLTRTVTQLYDQALRPAGLRVTQFTLLQALARAGSIPQGRLGRILALDSTTLTRTLAVLCKRGWITSSAGKDRRERLWALTASGQRQLERATPAWKQVQGRFRRAIGEAEWDNIQKALRHTGQAVRQI